MNSLHKEATVGLFVILGVVAFVLGAMWLRGKAWGNPPEVIAAYEDIGSLKVGSPVLISGVQIGRVEEFRFERVGRVLVVFTYDEEQVTPTVNATAQIRGIGLLGDMVIDFDPGEGAPLPRGQVIEGTMEAGFASIGADLADQASTALTSFNRMLDTNLVIELRSAVRASEQLMRYYADRRDGPTAEVNATMRQLQAVSARLDTAVAQANTAALSARLDSTLQAANVLTARLASMTARADSLMARIQRGEGTLGKLAADDGLYAELQRTLAATRALVDSLAQHPERLGITVRVF
jgi:phospholipid/cholesterol/gamma-HCH transport system substrate-binding protein